MQNASTVYTFIRILHVYLRTSTYCFDIRLRNFTYVYAYLTYISVFSMYCYAFLRFLRNPP